MVFGFSNSVTSEWRRFFEQQRGRPLLHRTAAFFALDSPLKVPPYTS